MPLHAELLERRIANDVTKLYFKIYDDDLGELGRVLVADGAGVDVKTVLRQEAQRLQALPVGKIVDL